jgi:hypothetical protein
MKRVVHFSQVLAPIPFETQSRNLTLLTVLTG